MEQQSFIDGYTFEPDPPQSGRNKFKTMIQLHGSAPEGKKCKTCSHLMPCGYHGKSFYKCELWRLSHSIATDIRLKQQACGQYNEVSAGSQRVRWIG